MKPRIGGLIGYDQAEQYIGMSAEIFGAGMHGDVSAARERREAQRRRPCIVHHQQRAVPMRKVRDRWHVLHFESERAWRLDEHNARVGLEVALDAGPCQRIVVAHLHTEALQMVFAKTPGRAV